MTFCLNSIIIKPEEGTEIKNAIILLHGYGGDGKDISMLTLNWKRHLPNTIFICPNGHEKCAINPSGYQWFDLTKEDPSYILEESIKAENIIKKFIEEVKAEYNLSNQQICLSGFSQGCMMSLNVGLTSNEKFLCVVGFSGKLIDEINLKNRIKNSTDTLLIHGDVDQRTPPRAARTYMKALKKYNKDHKVLWLEGADHFSNTLFYHHKSALYNTMTDYLANDCFENSNELVQR